jgi:hypothetical protein
MMNVRDYVNGNGCLISVTVENSGLVRYPALEDESHFKVRRDHRITKKEEFVSLDELVKMLFHPEHYPRAAVRCKPDRPGPLGDAGGIVMKKLDAEPLRRRLIQEGFEQLVVESVTNNPLATAREAAPADHAHSIPQATAGHYTLDTSRSDERKRILRDQATRRGQQRFRQSLVERYGETVCAISGCRVAEVVQAAHIVPYLAEQDNHPENGLLLRGDLHILFDRCLLGIEPDTLMVRLAAAPKEDPQYAKLDGFIPTLRHELSQAALRERWSWFLQGNCLQG